jgi:hypothetical protein
VRKPDPLLASGWLETLVSAELDRHDPASALARLPAEVSGRAGPAADLAPAAQLLVARSLRRRRLDAQPGGDAESFLEDVRLHLLLLLDLAVLRGVAFDRARREAEVAAFLAAVVGDWEAAVVAHPADAPPAPRAVRSAMRAAEAGLRARLFPPGDPVHGLPLYPGLVAIQRRLLARVAMGHHRVGRLDPAALQRHAEYAAHESALLVEALAGLLAAAEPVDARILAVRQRQLARMGSPRAALAALRRAVASPRAPEALAAAAPERVRPFLVEQLFLALLRAGLAAEGATRYVEAFAGASGLDAAALAAAQVEAAAQHGVHRVWFDAIEGGGATSWHAFADEWESAADHVVEKVSGAVTQNLGALVTEIRETGELGALLAKVAGGGALTLEEKRKVRAQLVDLAKAVPALAIFAAPGGLLLLPLLAKLLPFDLMPSAWDRKVPPAGGPADGAAPPKPPLAGNGG